MAVAATSSASLAEELREVSGRAAGAGRSTADAGVAVSADGTVVVGGGVVVVTVVVVGGSVVDTMGGAESAAPTKQRTKTA
jgi:hypothetical protein